MLFSLMQRDCYIEWTRISSLDVQPCGMTRGKTVTANFLKTGGNRVNLQILRFVKEAVLASLELASLFCEMPGVRSPGGF